MRHPHFLQYFGRHLRRYRKTHGYGIHSPRMYYLLREVILQQGAYYAYAPLAEAYERTPHKERNSLLKRKECELLFRLANDLRSAESYLVGCPTGIESAYLKAARSHIILCTSLPPERAGGSPIPPNRPARLYVVNGRNPEVPLAPTVEQILARLGESDALYIALPSNRKSFADNKKAWLSHPRAGIAFDLYTGLILLGEQGHFRQRLVRINF